MLLIGGQAMAKGSFYELSAKDIDGKNVSFEKYKGQVLLISNTASKCGYTPQYKSLEKVHGQFKDKGFSVLGFPSNDFGAQEPGSNAEIKKFCQLTFQVDFPLFSKAPVSGAEKQQVFKFLIENSPTNGEVQWNFEKFLIGKDGKVKARFPSKVSPDSEEVVKLIESELAVKQ